MLHDSKMVQPSENDQWDKLKVLSDDADNEYAMVDRMIVRLHQPGL